MKRRVVRVFSFVLFMGVLLGVVGGVPQSALTLPAAEPPADASLPWKVETIDDSFSRGSHVSIAVRERLLGSSIFIAYYDSEKGDLVLAKRDTWWNAKSYNCGGGGWRCELIDASGNVGQYASLDVNPQTGWAAIAYYDATLDGLKYFDNAPPVLIEGNSVLYDIGKYASLRIDSEFNPHIAYYSEAGSIGTDSLRYAKKASVPGLGNCGPSDNWVCTMIDSGDGVGQYTSLTLIGDIPYIAYYHGAEKALKVAHPAIGSFNCGPGNTWFCDDIDTTSGDFSNITIDTIDLNPVVAYYDTEDDTLKLAEGGYGTFGNCGDGNWYYCGDLVYQGASTNPVGSSMVVDPTPNLAIAYKEVTGEFSPPILKIGRPRAAYGPGTGNCIGGNWQCDTLDWGGQFARVADYVDIAFVSNGMGVIAYSELNTYEHPNTYSLKIAYQYYPVFIPMTRR